MMSKMTRAMVVVGAVAAGIACDYFGPTGVRIEVEREAGSYVFHFTSCRGTPIGVRGIRVGEVDLRRSSGGQTVYNDNQSCELELRASRPIRGSWRYGSVPPNGVLTTKCPPLKPGTYVVDVSGGEAGGYRDFRIEGDGSVKRGKGTCD